MTFSFDPALAGGESIFKRIAPILLCGVLIVFLTGCASTLSPATPAGDTGDGSEKSNQTTAIYYDFVDILVPNELKIIKDKTFVVSTPGFRSGVLMMKGRVEGHSLFNFFNTNMLKDNWNVVSQIKSPDTTIMVFEKPTRCAVVTIRDEEIYTYVEIGVAPRVQGTMQQMTPADIIDSGLAP